MADSFGQDSRPGFSLTDTAAVSVGRSSLVTRTRDELTRAARSNLRVFLAGEAGTGREAAARFVHQTLRRHLRQPGELHVLDTFSTGQPTDLSKIQPGSTLFVPELAETSKATQLRLHTQLCVWRRSLSAPRVVCTSRRPLHELRDDQVLLTELYYALSECVVELPALRKRREDIPLLAAAFLADLGMSQSLSPEARHALELHSWPGNVCELQAAIRRAGGMHPDQSLLEAELFSRALPSSSAGETDLDKLLDHNWAEAKDEFCRWYWTTLWLRFDGDKRRLLEHSRVSKVWLENRRRLYELHLSP